MKHTDTLIIGGGQAGLAMSRCLGDRGVDHVVLERGRIAERWRSERWDSLRMLTPRWQSRLPGWSYQGPDEHGYMTMPEVIDYLERYARSFSAPVQTGVTVSSVERLGDGFRVRSDAGEWAAANVVIATGHSNQPLVPPISKSLAPDIEQIVPSHYRHPGQLRDGGVLVVGASATGVQLASEIARSGRHVTLAVGRHTRLPRVYRGRDIMAWLDAMGVMSETTGQVYDIDASRAQPSLQLIGSDERRSLDLGVLRSEGVRVVGRLLGASSHRVYLADDLRDSIARSEVKMHEQLDRVDRYIAHMHLDGAFPMEARPARVVPSATPAAMSLAGEGIGTVLWATGYRRSYPWLHVPVLDARGEIEHTGGITAVPGMYALGLYFLRRRNSSLLDGVGADASELADHIFHRLAHNRLAVA
ncbi:MAG TPA: NAD(P)/FAD-dependent oxidoreductase [Candidatus Krumholzibacteria bacterium]|nr:NAD(P)/FAD-dependent oxidoreductase [Candidatus Krumholzibacteria bacterium]